MRTFLKKLFFFVAAKWICRKGPKGAIYLTFDDGPYPERTDKILKILKDKGVRATFFMIGEEMDRRRDIVNKVIESGHGIGYHGYDHKLLSELGKGEAVKDLERLSDVQAKFKKKIKLYRPPYGELSIGRMIWCIRNGIKIVLWTVDSRDSFVETPEEIVRNFDSNKIKDGDILLMHDDTELTVEALPGVIDMLQKKYQFEVLC